MSIVPDTALRSSTVALLMMLAGACGSDGLDPFAGDAAPGSAGLGGSSGSGSGGASGTGGANAGGSASGTGGTNPGGAPAGGAGGSPPDSGPPGDSSGASAKIWIPHSSWACGMPAGIPPPEAGTLVFDATFTLGEIHDVGSTQYGQRYLTEIKGGTAKGPRIDATFLDRGLDWQLVLSNGAIEVEQMNLLRTADGVSIYFRNCGVAPDSSGTVRVVPDFEAPNASAYAWMNTGKFVGTRVLDRQQRVLTMKVYDVSTVAPPAESLTIEQPANVTEQSWDCKPAAGTRGAVAFTERVGIGAGSVSIGASKLGNRNVIPITGGSVSGRVSGSVLSGGADYQLTGSPFRLDARYTLRTSDGVLILVRNCGAVGALVPVFETRADGPYAWLNNGHWLSSDPGIAPGAVNITIYDAN